MHLHHRTRHMSCMYVKLHVYVYAYTCMHAYMYMYVQYAYYINIKCVHISII